MTAPRLEIDLEKIFHNAAELVGRLGDRQISVMGVTKATLGLAAVARIMIQAGVTGLGDSRIENIEAMRRTGVEATMTLIRSPMLSQVRRVVACADISFNTEVDIIQRLSVAAQEIQVTHGVVLMMELGDLREGIMPADFMSVVRRTLRLPNLRLVGIGANLACRSGVSPDDKNMSDLSAMADAVESKFGVIVDVVSGGNSANLNWALHGGATGRINNLRLGEAILLGREPLHRQPIDGLFTNAITLIAEVIESKMKPSVPWGRIAETAFGAVENGASLEALGVCQQSQTILAIGHQDTDPAGLQLEKGMTLLGASSDHLVLETGRFALRPGSEIRLLPNYSALLRSMTSPFVQQVCKPMAQTISGPARVSLNT